jgi:hypothetical protein
MIGALALQRWREPRTTRRVDATRLRPFRVEAAAVDHLRTKFKPRITGERSLALQWRIMLLWATGRNRVDIAFGTLLFEERCAEKASDWEPSSRIVLHTCLAEYLVILKAFAGHLRDGIDIDFVLLRQGRSLDWRQILGGLMPLPESSETPEVPAKVQQLRSKIEKGA